MANRFLETNYYKSTFVRGLKGSLKGLYSFIICDCTPAGIWNKDIEAASMYIGFPITDSEFEEAFVLTGKAIAIGRGKYFFPDFIEHQYPKGLQEKNPAHSKIITDLQKLDILDENLKIKREKNEGAFKGLKSPLSNGNGNGNGNVMVKDKEVFKENEPQKKTFNTMPLPSDFNGLPEANITAIHEQLYIQRQIDLPRDKIIGMWEVFKIQNLTGKKYHPNEEEVYRYFGNWIKDKKFENGNNTDILNSRNGKQGTSAARTDALKKW